MSTPVDSDRSALDAVFDLIEERSAGFSVALLWLVPALAFLVAILHT